MPLSCNSNRDLTAIVEIARLQKPVSQFRILPGVPSDQHKYKPVQDTCNPSIPAPSGPVQLRTLSGWLIVIRRHGQPHRPRPHPHTTSPGLGGTRHLSRMGQPHQRGRPLATWERTIGTDVWIACDDTIQDGRWVRSPAAIYFSEPPRDGIDPAAARRMAAQLLNAADLLDG